MREGGESLCLPLQASQPGRIAGELLWKQLESHATFELRVLGEVHDAHAAAPQLLEDPKMSER